MKILNWWMQEAFKMGWTHKSWIPSFPNISKEKTFRGWIKFDWKQKIPECTFRPDTLYIDMHANTVRWVRNKALFIWYWAFDPWNIAACMVVLSIETTVQFWKASKYMDWRLFMWIIPLSGRRSGFQICARFLVRRLFWRLSFVSYKEVMRHKTQGNKHQARSQEIGATVLQASMCNFSDVTWRLIKWKEELNLLSDIQFRSAGSCSLLIMCLAS